MISLRLFTLSEGYTLSLSVFIWMTAVIRWRVNTHTRSPGRLRQYLLCNNMGNCFKAPTNDDISLLRGNESQEGSDTSTNLGPPPTYQESVRVPVYHPSPNVSRPASQLTEEEQVKIAKRLGLIQHLPTGVYDGTCKKAKECVICMGEFVLGDPLRYLPCMHTYHKECIDDWLMRSFTCPSCMEPVDAALLTTYETSPP